MKRRVLGLIVAGGRGPLEDLGVADDALTPFAGKYRFIDLALATLVNSDVTPVYVAAPSPSTLLCRHLARAARSVRALRRRFPVRLPGVPASSADRAARVLRALAGCRHLLHAHRAEAVVVLTTDHILQLDARQLLDAHEARGADLMLCTLPLTVGEASGRTVLEIEDGERVRGVRPPAPPDPARRGFAFAWTGDLVVSAAALSAVLEPITAEPGAGDAELLASLAQALHVAAYDVLDNHIPGGEQHAGAFWHDPRSLEAYYDAQMNLCTPRPELDLYNPDWPLWPVAGGLGPAKVVADAAGRAGQALNSLVSDGAVVRGGVVVNTVVGHGVVVESGAEVENSVLLDGCRVGRGARVRRAVVGAGAVIGDADEIGYETSPASPARLRASGLTVVPATLPGMLAGARAAVAAGG
jgi:glucose-1-phosphate adenylyltransferase